MGDPAGASASTSRRARLSSFPFSSLRAGTNATARAGAARDRLAAVCQVARLPTRLVRLRPATRLEPVIPRNHPRPVTARWLLVAAVACVVLAGCGGGSHHHRRSVISPSVRTAPSIPTVEQVTPAGIQKIQHVVIIVQENRSFDSYFGTYPGADGLPAKDGQFTVCLPDPARGGCDPPFHDASLVNGGGPHGQGAAYDDIDGGRMDGFVRLSETAGGRGCGGFAGVCSPSASSDVM